MMEKRNRILLFDIDGTLMDSTGEGKTCFGRALEDVYGVTGPIDTYSMAGKTDWQIVTELMHLAGLDAERIEAGRENAFRAYARHVEITAPTFKMRALPGVLALLARLADEQRFILGLVTGNVREAVPYKLRAVGIDPGAFLFGAFGSDHLDRNHLPPLALYRFSQLIGTPLPPESALVIGDTPLDIACARFAGVKVLSVASGQFSLETLAEHQPDFLLQNLRDTEAVLAILHRY